MSKTYLNGIFLKERKFDNGGSIINATITETFVNDCLDKMDNGKIRVKICSRREPDKNGNTHYVEVDDWKPSQQQIEEHKKDDIPF